MKYQTFAKTARMNLNGGGMGAGTSAGEESRRLEAQAQLHEAEARRAREEAGRFAAAAVAERSLAKKLSPLIAYGFHLLTDRQWPGSRNGQLDLIVVGPSGVWIVDSKHWRDFFVAGGHIWRDQADESETILRLQDVANDAELAFSEVGLAPGEIHALVVMHGHKGYIGNVGPVEVVGALDVHKHLVALKRRLSTQEVELVLKVAMEYFPPYVGPQTPPTKVLVSEPALEEIDELELSDDALITEEEVQEILSKADLEAPIEEWMTFLHPFQASLVRKSFNGPSRVAGPAGTGKTVVALHRAAYLARLHPNRKILFTTFVKTLPMVMAGLFKRLAPTLFDRVEFTSVHSLAARILRERGVKFRVDSRQASELMRQAWIELEPAQQLRLIKRATANKQKSDVSYWQEEVESVIKGRGFVNLEQYLACSRPGRLVRLNVDDRSAVWSLYVKYQNKLRSAGIGDFQDQVLLAEKALSQEPLNTYAAVIIDEAQDLTLAMVRMLYSLVGETRDGITFIGDGRQRVYPGGFVLSEADISLSGRGVSLENNYRNTAEIQAFASSILESATFDDFDDSFQAVRITKGSEPENSEQLRKSKQRHGPVPEILRFGSRTEHDKALIDRITKAISASNPSAGDIGILCNTNAEVDRLSKLLDSSGIPSINLLEYAGEQAKKVKVGTIKRAKGLEFKFVLLPWLIPSTDSRRSHSELEAQELYVAVTRARDQLWLGYC
mgnify:CR=1 FL=1